jgi:urease beta subunit
MGNRRSQELTSAASVRMEPGEQVEVTALAKLH